MFKSKSGKEKIKVENIISQMSSEELLERLYYLKKSYYEQDKIISEAKREEEYEAYKYDRFNDSNSRAAESVQKQIYGEIVSVVVLLASRKSICPSECKHPLIVATNYIKKLRTKDNSFISGETIFLCPFCGQRIEEKKLHYESYRSEPYYLNNFGDCMHDSDYLCENAQSVYKNVKTEAELAQEREQAEINNWKSLIKKKY